MNKFTQLKRLPYEAPDVSQVPVGMSVPLMQSTLPDVLIFDDVEEVTLIW